MTTTDSHTWMAATPDNNVFGLLTNQCLISESTVPGHLPELFFYDPEKDDDRDLELGWHIASGERYEALVGMWAAMGDRWIAWHAEHGVPLPEPAVEPEPLA